MPDSPTILTHDAWTYDSCVLFTIGASDISGIFAYQLFSKVATGDWTFEETTTLPTPYECIGTIQFLKQCSAGDTVALSATFMNQYGLTTSTSSSAQSLTGTYYIPPVPVSGTPTIEINICEDTTIEITWTSWEEYVNYTYKIPGYPIRWFEVYRKLSTESTYTYLGSASGSVSSYIDTTNPAIGYNDYRVVGIDYFYKRFALGGRANIVDNPDPGLIPFIEPYCAMLPVWTAAPAKVHTTRKIFG